VVPALNSGGKALSITTPRMFFDWLFKEQSEYDVFEHKEEFAIRVLSTPSPISGIPDSLGEYIFMGRILDDGAPSPHIAFLTDPCDISVSSDEAATSQLTAMHTRFTFFASTVPSFTIGDVIYGLLDADIPEDGGGYNLQFAHLERVKEQVMASAKATNLEACQSLEQMMQNQAPISLGNFSQALGVGRAGAPMSRNLGGSSTPLSQYPPCVGGERAWIKISINEFARKVKSTVSNKNVALSIIALAITEQPIEGSTDLGGFNYNHYGVMADVGPGWGGAGKTYIKCSVPSTEGAGGSGDRREKVRWFAAFESVEAGIKFMETKLSARKTTDENGKPISFKTVDNGLDWAKLHTLKWLSPTGKEEIIKNTSKMKSKGKNFDKAVAAYNSV
jgi:hypothetical protein